MSTGLPAKNVLLTGPQPESGLLITSHMTTMEREIPRERVRECRFPAAMLSIAVTAS